MKKRFLVLFLALAIVLALGIVAIAADGEEAEAETITISYMKTQDTTSDTTDLDKTAYANGKQTVGKGEKFTLPTTSSNSYTGKEGFQLIWYTENGKTYKAGETVSFDKDTKLFRCVSKEVYTMADLNYAMYSESKSAIMMADINTNSGISVESQGQSVLILNGYTLTITKNSGGFMGSQRSGKHIYGEGTVNAVNPDGKLGEYYFFQDQSHSYNGNANKTVIGVDVTINCPTMWLGADGDGANNNHYPWTRIFGKVNCYGLINITHVNARAPFTEIFESASVTITGPKLFKDAGWRGNDSYSFNNQAFELRIYGGTFNLPAEASTRSFWTNDYDEYYEVSNRYKYYPMPLTEGTKDVIKIFGGSFVLPDNAVPAIAEYLTTDFIGSIPSGGNGLVANKDTSTYHVAYMNRPGYKLAFEKYTIAEGAYGKLTVTDYIDGSISGTYYYQMETGTIEFVDPYKEVYESANKNTVQNVISSIKVFEKVDDTTYVETTKFQLDYAMQSVVMFSNSIIKADGKLQNFEANGAIYQTVVPTGCEHSFTGAPVDANCEHCAYADYNCSVCNHNVYFAWGERADHNYVLGEHIQATQSSLGSKTYTCAYCADSKIAPYSLNPVNLEVAVTIRNDDGTFENITVLASEIFEFSTSGSGDDYIYTLSGIKKFGTYNIRNIHGVTIPKGILYVNITTQNYEKYENVEYSVIVLTIAEGATVDIQNIGNLRRLDKIVVEKNTNVIFSSSCGYYSPNNEKRSLSQLTTIDLSAGNHNVKIMNSAFEGRDWNGTLSRYLCKLDTIIFGANASYNVGDYSFKNCVLKELNLPASSTYIFGAYTFEMNNFVSLTFPNDLDLTFGSSCFYNCKQLVSVTFGQNATYNIGNSCFRYSPIPKVVFAPNSTYTIGSQAFINSTLVEVDASAGNMTITFNSNAFNCWLDNKLYCTLATLKLGENSTYSFGENSFSNSSIEAITLASDSSYTFIKNCFTGDTTKATLKAIDASADNITVIWNGESFRDRTNLETLLLSGKNSNHTFGGTSFYNTKITELDFGEGSTIVFEGSCFNGSTPIASVDTSASNINVTFKQNAFRDKATLTELLINGEGSTYHIVYEAFFKTGVKSLTLGKDSTYTFERYGFSNCSVESIDATASGITANFQSNAFVNMSALQYLNFGKYSTYTFGEYAFSGTNPTNDIIFSNTSTFSIGKCAFKQTDFASVTFEDNTLAEGQYVTFDGVEAFYECAKATSLYIGKNLAITNYPFKKFNSLETLYIMEGVTHTSEWEFEYAGSADLSTQLYVYNHSLDFDFKRGTFHECDGIILYTVTDNIGTNGEVFRSCGNWTIYLCTSGPLEKGKINPTCEENGYDTYVCACGKDCDFYLTETQTINLYLTKHNIKDTTTPDGSTDYEVTLIAPNGHDTIGEIINVAYNSFLEKGTGTFICSVCGTEHTKEASVNPIFTWLGYSTNINVYTQFAISYRIDHDMLEQYESLTGNKLVYGVVGAVTQNLGGKTPFDETLGEAGKKYVSSQLPRENDGVQLSEISFRILGFTEARYELEVTMFGYIKETKTDAETAEEVSTTVYFQAEQTENPASNSISKYVASLPPKGDEEETA